MGSLHRVRDLLVSGHVCDVLDLDEFVLLYDINAPSNPCFQYDNDVHFNLENLNDDENTAFSDSQETNCTDCRELPEFQTLFKTSTGQWLKASWFEGSGYNLPALCVSVSVWEHGEELWETSTATVVPSIQVCFRLHLQYP